MAETIRNENEKIKINVKAPIMAKKNKQHQTCPVGHLKAVCTVSYNRGVEHKLGQNPKKPAAQRKP